MIARNVLNLFLMLIIGSPSYGGEWYAEHSPWGKAPSNKDKSEILREQRQASLSNEIENSSVVVELTKSATIRGTRALAGDILSCEGDQRICALINSVDLGIDLEKNSSKILTRNRVITLINGEIDADISFGGSATVKVERKRYTVDGDRIRDRIKDILEANLHCGASCKIGFTVSPVLQKHLLFSSDWDLKIHNLDEVGRKILSSSKINSVKVKWSFVGETQKSKYTFVKIDRLKRKLVFKSDLARGASVSPGDVEYRWVSDRDKTYFEPDFETHNFTVKRAVKSGQLVSTRSMKMPFLVKRGQVVDLITKRGSLTIKLSGKALNNAHLGSEVSVRVLGKKAKRLTGIARSGNVVEVL